MKKVEYEVQASHPGVNNGKWYVVSHAYQKNPSSSKRKSLNILAGYEEICETSKFRIIKRTITEEVVK